jgi:hypothetical protein
MMTIAFKESEISVVSNVLGSAAAGIVGRIVTHPLDTAKARLQSLSGASYRGPADALVKTFRSEGIRGLYRGFPTVIVGGTPGTIIYLCGYDIFKDRISSSLSKHDGTQSSKNGEESFAVHFAAGILAETVACLIYVPVDVIKERLQIQNKNDLVQYKGGWDALVKISKTEGPMGIYKGYGATLASFGPFSALVGLFCILLFPSTIQESLFSKKYHAFFQYFVFYEKFKLWSREYLQGSQDDNITSTANETMSGEIPLSFIILSSASAGAISSFLTSPLDMVKLRLQVQRKTESLSLSSSKESATAFKTNPLYRGMSDALVHSYRYGGIPGLFRGAGARVIHFVPLTTIIMTSYETCRSFIHKTLIQ